MELKVWVEGVVRVVCGLSLHTSCQDVVIALAQAIGQTGRYILFLKLRGNERQLVANDCPLQHLAQLGQLATEAQFILHRTGPSLSDGQEMPTRERFFLPRPNKAVTFNLGPSSLSKRTKPNRTSSPNPSKEEVFKQILQKQRQLQDLESQVQALERETWLWEQKRSSATVQSLSVAIAEELEELQQQLRRNEAELIHSTHWEGDLQIEMDREQDMHIHLHQLQSLLEEHSYRMKEIQISSAHLEHNIQLTTHRQSSQAAPWQQKETMLPLRQELHNRLQQGEELDVAFSGTQEELRATERMLQDRWELIEELNKELRQCNLQQFIQQTGGPHADQTNSLPVTEVYLSIAGVME
ncbi:ras association domain-containing protein 7-like [Solea solea]|uniref:ras association domain-containing protein 7-like n=1 Tax=Solea solea TaxID=90069 RepID=UPI00272CCBD3|nr:ras association domain-containing protein 7-like [Solea solea]XP_058485011.1 ras association domain-containing protein 7-like [Solea solea]XP_058485012.1 ras association domain-containing protein 7-like [Solea solea]XP_058485013.1 ras association domain-containing protein 7-like [Solea solea]